MRSGDAREIGRIAASALVVTASLAALLRAADALPGLFSGETGRVLRFGSVGEAERALGVRIALPHYFPDLLRWPPSVIRAARGRASAVEVRFDGRDGRAGRLSVYVALSPGGEIPSTLRAAGRPFHRLPVTVKGRASLLTSVLVAGEGVFLELPAEAGGERVLLRFDGPAEELLRIAESLPAEAP